jgi:hypothetical protein
MQTQETIMVTDYTQGGIKVPAVITTVKTDKESKMYLKYIKQ